MDVKLLIEKALEAQRMAYTPYSNFKVGAALLTKSGKIYKGCNIESASYSPTNCAERTAFFTAVSEGETQFEAIAIVGGYLDKKDYNPDYCYPCGVCRQVMMEFCNPKEFKVVMAKSNSEYVINTLEELLPFGFGPKSLI